MNSVWNSILSRLRRLLVHLALTTRIHVLGVAGYIFLAPIASLNSFARKCRGPGSQQQLPTARSQIATLSRIWGNSRHQQFDLDVKRSRGDTAEQPSEGGAFAV
jgi:hypothetical protein